jgi:ankyrin repeat protein
VRADRGALRALLEHGADPNRTNAHGNTPLFTAVFNSRGRGDLITMLREHGAGRTSPTRVIGNYDVVADLPA